MCGVGGIPESDIQGADEFVSAMVKDPTNFAEGGTGNGFVDWPTTGDYMGGGEQNFVRTQDGRNSLLVIGAGRLNLYMNQVNADLKGDIDPNPS
ncbi:hypothetical protein KBC31_01015 [Candidatus Saccharibacteria bacterium]|nr:hypothetical protein [Candidatus Saccharibacteria bacterium]